MENTGPGLHAGPLVVHTALAMGQRTGAGGADMLTAIALGYDLNARFHLARTADEDLRHLNIGGAGEELVGAGDLVVEECDEESVEVPDGRDEDTGAMG